VAEIFVSYTSDDKGWADWIGLELEKLGHEARLFDWEVSGGGNVAKWMVDRHDEADHVLCVVSPSYLDKTKRYSEWERLGAMLAAVNGRENFVLPVFVESCEAPTLLATTKRCDLYGLREADARARLAEYLKPAAKPSGRVPFPGARATKGGTRPPQAAVSFPDKSRALSNIPITVPRFFLGREEVLKDLRAALANNKERIAITTLLGLRGVGKTTLAAAYAFHHRGDYLVTWWIRAEAPSTLRADLVGLGVRLGWVAGDEKEEAAVATVMDRLRDEGGGILLIFDNAIDADSVEPYFPAATDAHILVTSNAHAWRDIATPLRIDTWPPDIGADYLISRTGRTSERQAAVALSNALGGLPLAHEQAAAYCERLEVSFATYRDRFDRSPATVLSDPRDAPRAYHNRLTAAKTFALAIEEAGTRHPAVEPLITFAALLAPEPIPLFLFAEGREQLGEPLVSTLAGDGLDEAVGVLRTFALVDREPIPDEREPSVTTDCIRLHRLVRDVAAARSDADTKATLQGKLIDATARVYPKTIRRDPSTWPRARRLDPLAMAMVNSKEFSEIFVEGFTELLAGLEAYRDGALAAYAEAQKLCELALERAEKRRGPDHPETARNLNNLGGLLYSQGDFAGARPHYERALSINERMLGPEHPETARCFNNLAGVLDSLGDLAGARRYYERALAIRERALGPDHPDTARSHNNLGFLLKRQGDLDGARRYYDSALAISERALGPRHPGIASILNNLGSLLQEQGDFSGALSHFKRALDIRDKALGDHPDTAFVLNNLGNLLRSQHDLAGARPHFQRALGIFETVLGPDHPDTKTVARNTVALLDELGTIAEAHSLRQKFGLKDDE
jgi:tetratricopeptide (TPR) repeat protein